MVVLVLGVASIRGSASNLDWVSYFISFTLLCLK